MTRITTRELRGNLSSILDRAEAGETFEVVAGVSPHGKTKPRVRAVLGPSPLKTPEPS